MITQNYKQLQLSSEELSQIMNAIQLLENLIGPHLIQLSTAEKRCLPKMGDKSIPFVQKAYQYSLQNPSLLPPYIGEEKFESDVKAMQDYTEINRSLMRLVNKLKDTVALSSSEAFVDALEFYKSVKSASKLNVDNSHTVCNDLAKRFPSKASKTITDTSPEKEPNYASQQVVTYNNA